MKERWYRWFGSSTKGATVGVERIDRPASGDFVPHVFQMDESDFQAAVAPLFQDWCGVKFKCAKRGKGKPDLLERKQPGVEARRWIELKDAALKPACRWGSGKGRVTLRQQVEHYLKKYPPPGPGERDDLLGSDVHVAGLGVEGTWGRPGLRFHAVQPGFLLGGGAILRLAWDVDDDSVDQRLWLARFLDPASLYAGLISYLTAQVAGVTSAWRYEDHRRRLRLATEVGLRLRMKLWPDESGRPKLHVRYYASSSVAGAGKLLEKYFPAKAKRVIPLDGPVEQILADAQRRELSHEDWRRLGALDPLLDLTQELARPAAG